MASLVVLLVLLWQKDKEGETSTFRLLCFIGLFLFLGLWRYAIDLPTNTPDKIWYYNGQTVTIEGVVSNEPDIRQTNQKLEIKVGKIKTSPQSSPSKGEEEYSVTGKVLVTTNLYPEHNYGDELEIICDLQAPERFRGFAYDRYLARFDIYSVCYYPRIAPTPSPSPATALRERGDGKNSSLSREVRTGEGQGGGNWLYSRIFNVKNKLREIIDFGMSEPESSLARAIILGDKKGIPDELRQEFSQAGISHIVAISGMHISIIAVLLMGLLLGIGLPRKKAFWLASLFLIFYIMLIGLPASAMRAGLMGFLVLWAMNLGRLNKLTNSLVLAAVVLLLINPKLLRDDIGFQLSFLAVLGIAYGYPILSNWYNTVIAKPVKPAEESHEDSNNLNITDKRSYRFTSFRSRMTKKMKVVFDILAITIAAQLFTLPIIALNFNQVSLVSPITNLLVLWTLPILMIASLVALGLSLIFSGFAFIFFLPAWLLLKYIIIIAENITKLPYAFIEIDYLWWGWLIVYYVVVGWVVYRIKKRPERTNI